MFSQVNKWLYISFGLIFCLTFFTKNNYHGVNRIAPDVLHAPVQEKIKGNEHIDFEIKGYSYDLTPVFEYEINALVVSKLNYKLFGIYRSDSIFPVDLCMIWGDNVLQKLYKNWTLRFSQDCRWCEVEWWGNLDFKLNEYSNCHLVTNKKSILKKINRIVVGDQLRIKGKLVNIEGALVGKPDRYTPRQLSWKSSVSRTDSGAGACEIIYVEDIVFLRKANQISYYLFHLSLYGLLILTAVNIVRFFV
ncbi:MAG: hypothetical protein WDL87_08465 [Candidatus Omnitrophota bacterium]|jgi:hypothetical protein